MSIYHSDTGTHTSAPGAWWWHHREYPSLAYKGGTYCVTIGHPFSDDDKFALRWNRVVGAVMDDFGNLQPVRVAS